MDKILKSFSNSELRELLFEFQKIGSSEIPNKVEKSENMKLLWDCYDSGMVFCEFYKTYSNVHTLIEYEIINRFKETKIN